MSAAKAGKRPLRSLTAQEKLNAIKRVSVGGESKASVARDIGVPESTLRGWCKNQEKISYQVRTSPSNLEDSPENLNIMPAKRMKIEDQPFNLSMKTSDVSNGSYSPNSESNFESEYPKPSEPELETSPLNLRTSKPSEPLAPAPVITSTPKSTNNNVSIEKERQDKVTEKNKAELAKLSAELGLNRPEVLVSTLNGTSNINDLTTALLQWRSVYQTWYYQQQQKLLQQQNKSTGITPTPATTDMPSKVISPGNGLLTTVDKRDKMLPHVDQQPSVYDSVSYWLRQQSLLGLNTNSQQPLLTSMTSCLPLTSANTSVTNTSTPTSQVLPTTLNLTTNHATHSTPTQQQNTRLWSSWYQQSYNSQFGTVPATTAQSQSQLSPGQRSDNKQILYQHLTKDPVEKEVNSENELTKDDKPKNLNKNRSVLDNILLNNNTIECSPKKEEVATLDAHEAIEHGEKFLQWLEEHCSDPSVTTMQVHTVQSLIKNLKHGIDRKSNDIQSRNKVRRK